MHVISIVGSCVTRDALGHVNDQVVIPWYQARTSIASMVTPPVAIDLDYEASAMPKFEKRSVRADLEKTWREHIAEAGAKAVLLDFIDERFGLGVKDGSYFTYSTAFRGVAGEPATRFLERYVSPISEEYLALLRDLLPVFCERVSDIPNVIVNDASWVLTKDDGSGFPDNWVKMVAPQNRLLDEIFETLAKRTSVSFLGISRDALTAKAGHRWDDTPFHYSDESEQLIANRILAKLDAISPAQGA